MDSPIKYFEDEGEARAIAGLDIRDILNNPQFIYPDRFSTLISDYRKKQKIFDSEICISIKLQVEGISASHKLIEECTQEINTIKNELYALNSQWSKDESWHQDMKLYDKILNFRKNIQIVLDQLYNFMNVSSQIKDLEQFYKDPHCFEFVQTQLQWLIELKENIEEKIESDPSTDTKEAREILAPFEELDIFHTKFYDNIYNIIKNALEISKQNPKLLIKALQVLKNAKVIHKAENSKYQDRCIEVIRQSVINRFNEKFSNAVDLADILNNLNFTIEDLGQIYDYVVPCFSAEYDDIFRRYEEFYKTAVQDRIIKFLEDEETLKASPGVLVALTGWLDSYELLLKRTGIEANNHSILREKIELLKPVFLKHLEAEITRAILNRIELDKSFESESNLENFEKTKAPHEEFVSTLPQDIFSIINTNLFEISKNIKGGFFVDVIEYKICKDCLMNYQEREKFKLLNNAQSYEIRKLILYINNFFKCILFTGDTLKLAQNFVDQTFQEHIENNLSELSKEFHNSIDAIQQMVIRFSFHEIVEEVIFKLFTHEWKEGKLINLALVTLEDYIFNIFLRLLISPLHKAKIIKGCFEHLINLYFEKFLFGVSKIKKALKNWSPMILDIKKMKKLRKEKNEKSVNASIFTSLKELEKNIQRDLHAIKAEINEKYFSYINKAFLDKFLSKFEMLFKLFIIPKFDLEASLVTVHDIFDNQGLYILEAVLLIREDCDHNFKKSMLAFYGNFIIKQE